MFGVENLLISKILLSYCQNEKYADEEFIEKILKIIINSRKYKNYVDKILVDDGKDGESGYYNYLTKELFFRLSPRNVDVYKYNLMMLHCILHECEHIGQYKICEKKDDSLRKTLLLESFYDTLLCKKMQNFDFEKASLSDIEKIKGNMSYAELRRQIYPNIYGFLPSERMAEIDSFEKILTSLDKIKLDGLRTEKSSYQKGYNIRKLLGYSQEKGEVKCPTFKLYNELNNICCNNELLDEVVHNLNKVSNEMDLDTRLYYGLPIHIEEYKSVLRKIK